MDGMDDDISVVYLQWDLTIGPGVNVINLATSSTVDAGTPAQVTGWGATRENGNLSPYLKSVTMPIAANDACDKAYGIITANMICAGVTAGNT